jgi:hypothetical protein
MGAPHEPARNTSPTGSELRVCYEFPYTGQEHAP